MWEITEKDLNPAAIGAAILGTGGGGNPYLGRLRARAEMRAGKKIEIIDPTEIADDDLLVVAGGMGSPVVAYEKVAGGNEETDAVQALERYLGRRFTAIAPFEMGGGNSMVPLVVGARLGIPVVDGDGMGRAFPELQMITYLIYGGSPFPAALADERGNRIVVDRILDAHWLERILRSVTIDMGGHAGLATAVMDGEFCRKFIIPNTLSLAIRIGRAVLAARKLHEDPGEAIVRQTGGRRYIRGKVVDVERRATRGFAKGRLVIDGSDDDAGRRVEIDFQNENLVIREGERVPVTVPDLITLVTSDEGEPITTELVRYGLRTDVLVIPCPDLLKTPRALEVVGPRAFGYDIDYRPLAT